MTLEELEKFPNTLDALRNYYKKKLESSIDETADVPDDFKEMVRMHGITHVDDTIVAVTESNPASLFYFFDEYNIFINIAAYSSGLFGYSILGNLATVGTNTTFPSRKGAEKQSIQIAISELEKSLTNSVSSKENS